MSLKTTLLKSKILMHIVKWGIKLTPKVLVVTVANLVLRGIAEFSELTYDLDKRTAYVKVTLYGEEEAIEVKVDGFGITRDNDQYQFILQQAKSNKPWLSNVLDKITGKAWDIPPVPQFQDEVDFVATLLKYDASEQNKVA
jgi:hypothetical protein